MPGVSHSQSIASPEARHTRAARQLMRASAMFGADFVPMRVPITQPSPAIPAAAAQAPEPAQPAFSLRDRTPVTTARLTPVSAVPSRPEPASASRDPAIAPAVVEAKPREQTSGQRESQARLDALRARYEAEEPHKNFVTDHHCIVFGDGDPCARLMIIGEAPGAEEDKVGLPFVGRAGQLLEKMLTAMGLSRSQVYITNVLKTRPPNNATPTADEAAACAPYLYEQIRIISPECILSLGLPATKVLLNTVDSMSRLRGRWWSYADPRTVGFEVPVMPTYHPAFLLRSYTRENREKVWSDLQMIMQRLGLTAGQARG